MKPSIGYLVAVLTALPPEAYAQCIEGKPLNPCEVALYDTVVECHAESKERKVLITSLREKLRIRTSTSVNALVVPPEQKVDSVGVRTMWLIGALSAALGLVVGASVAVIVGR